MVDLATATHAVTVHSELFVATRRNALRFAVRRATADAPDYTRAAGQGVLPEDLEALWAVLVQEPLDPARHQLENLRFGARNPTGWRRLRRKLLILAAVARSVTGGEGADAGLYRLPPAYVRLLAAIRDDAVATCARNWTVSSSWAARAGSDAPRLLEDLRRLARHSLAVDRPMFLWGETVADAENAAGA